MQRLDDFKVSYQRPQFCRGTQIQLGALVDVEWLIKVVGLDTGFRSLRRQFGKREAVDDLARIGFAQQVVAVEPGKTRVVRIPEMAQDLSLIHISEPTRQAEISYA